jgi:hypothetical protein
MFRPKQSPAQPSGTNVDDKNRDDNHQEDSADIRIEELTNRNHEFLPYTASADKPHDRRFAHVDFEPQQRIAGKPGITCGNTAKRIDDSQLAPVDRTPSSGFISMFSACSE